MMKPTDAENSTARHFSMLANAIPDLQNDLQALLNQSMKDRQRIEQLEKALDKAIKMQGTETKFTKDDLLKEDKPQ